MNEKFPWDKEYEFSLPSISKEDYEKLTGLFQLFDTVTWFIHLAALNGISPYTIIKDLQEAYPNYHFTVKRIASEAEALHTPLHHKFNKLEYEYSQQLK